jgi:hypothetical protein
MSKQEFEICREYERNRNHKLPNLKIQNDISLTCTSISACVKNSKVTSEAREGSICEGANMSYCNVNLHAWMDEE